MINNYDSVDTRFSTGSPTSTKQGETSYTGKKRTWLWLIALFVTLFSFVSVQAQTTANYAFSTATTGSLALDANGNSVDMSTGTTQLIGAASDSGASSVTNIGFNYYFYGNPFTQFSVSANGMLQLGSTAVSGTTYVASGGSTTAPKFSPIASDAITASTTDGGGVFSKVVGSAPNRCLVVQWVEYLYYGNTTSPATFQMRLYETTGVIEYVYGAMPVGATAYSSGYSIGFSAGSSANQLACITTSANTVSTSTFTTNAYTAGTSIANLDSSANGSRRVYKFTPPVPASGPTGLTFATVSTTGMTLNWTAAADLTNLVKYVVFNSTNGGTTYNYVNTVALGTNTYAATGLIPGTTYTWKVVAISEGVESTPATGAQATLNGATYYWTGATGDAFATLGKWNTMADGTGTAPTAFAATDVYIIDGDGTTPGGSTTINIGAAVSVGQLKITSNTEVTLQSSTTTTRTITVTGGPGDDFVVESGSTLNLTHATQAAAIVFSGTGNTGLVAGTINFAGSTSNAITTTGGTGTLVTVSGSVINNIAGSSGSITGSVTSLAFTAGSNYLHGSFTTTNGFIPLATWDVASTVTITGGTTSTGITNTTQSFGNFVYNSTTSTATMSVFTSATTAIVQGNLTITATGTGKFRATTSGTVTVNGDLILNGGTFEVSSTSGTVKVLGNVIQNGGRLDVTSGSSTASLLVAGQFNQVAGDLLVSGSSSTNKIEFNGTTAQNVSFAGTTNGSVVFRVNNAAGINLTGTMNINVKGSLIISNGNITGSGSVVYIPTHSYTSAAGATSSTTTITVASTVGLQVGMTVTVSAGVGVFAANTTVTAINTATTFTVSTAPTTALSGGASVVSGTFTGTNTLTYNGAVAQTANSLEFPATNGPASLTINNTATAPNNVVTVPFTRTLVGTAGTLTLTAGILDNSTYVLTVPNTAVAAVSAGSATAYMKGALERSLPASLVTGSTYSFPVGKSGFNPFALVNPLTNAGGTVSVKAEVFDAATGGTNGTLIGALNTNRYWAASITNGSANFTNALVKLSDTPNGADAIASSTTLTGAYSMVGGLTTTATASSLQSTTPEVTTLDGYYVMASKAAATLATPTVTPSGNQCTNVARAISVLITPGGGAITTVVLNYSINGVAQTAINMTNSTNNGALVADTWTATIPTVTPTNATITWSITATDANSLTRSVTGTAYTDEPNLGVSATAAASLATVCAGSPSSLSISFSNAAPSTLYSTPSVTNATTDEDLGNVTITQGATTILNNTSAINSLTGTIGAATGTAGAFSNYTSFGPYAVTAGQTYNFSLSSLQSTTAYGNSMAIFIDYNRDGDFADAGENVYAATATTSGAHTETGSFTIPATAFNGKTRMRVICNEGTIASSTPSVSYGEYEDYMLNITSSNVGGGATVATPTAYSWSDGTSVVGTTNPLVVNPTTTTTYTGTATVNGCPITATTTVTVNPLPTAPTATNSTQCGTQIPSASVADTNAFTTPTFKWYDAATAGTVVQSSTSTTFTSSISATTTFYVAVVHPTTGCESPRTAVTVSVSTPDAITATSTATSICIGQSITLTAANSATTPAQTYAYSWLSTANSGVATAQSGASITATPTTVGSYTYTVTAVDGSCQTTATVTVTVNPLPVITTATASPNVACAGSTINLDATVINIQAGATNLGAGASTSSSAGQSFLPGAWGGAKTQYLIRASELTALGYSAGNITSLGFEPTTSGQTYTGFQLWVDQTSTTDLTTTFLPTGTQVYLATGTNDAFTPVANTVNTLAFGTGSGSSSSFNWDGTSNLVVTFSWSSVPSATTSTGSTMKVDAPGFTCTTYKQSDSVTPAAMLASTTGTTGTNRPKFILGGQIATNVTSSYNWTWSIGSTNVLNTASGTTTVPTGATTTYTVTATNIATGCSASQNVTVSTNVAALSMFAIAPQASSICVGETVTMFANPTGGCIPYTYSWSDGTSVVGTAATLAVTPTSDKTYTLTITDNAGTQLVKTATVTVNNPQPASVAGQTICANSSAFTLSATESTPGNLLNWYAAQTGGSVLASGSTFTTPSISATTTYYVEENALGAVNAGLGRASTTATTSTTPSTYGLVFNLNVKSKLNSVDVYLASATAGNLVVQLQNSTGAVINSKTIAVPAGNATTPVQYTVPLDFIIPAGTGYRLLAISGTSMVRESALGGFPYSLSYFGDITSGYISGTSTSYYFFYNWSLSDICTGLRVPVTATLNIPPSITLSGASDTICNGQATTTAVTVATGGSSYDVYTWSPITGVTGNSSTGWTFNPTSSTTYTLTASQSAGTCSTTATYVVNVNPTPSAITIAPAAPAVCVNSIQALTVTGGTVGSTVNVGTATTTNATTAYPSPFTNYYGGAKHQMLIKASELTALGLMPNIPIQSLSFEVTAVGSTFTGTLQNFQVDMASTSATVLTSTAFLPATTNVRAAADLPVAVGVVTIPLNGQFAWDGVSNIVIQTSYSNTNSGTSTDFVQMKNSDPGFVSTNWYRADSATAASILGATTPSGSGNARPNMVLDNSASTNITWSPTTNLYTDAAATTPYTGGYATTVYVKSATAATTTYTVSSVTSTGCSASGTVTVTVNALPTVATVNPAPVCAPATIDLTASAVTTGSETGLTFTYFTDSAATTALATPSAVATSGTYYIKGTNANGCSVVMPVTVTINLLPTVTTVAPATVCYPSTVDLTASAVTTGSDSGLTYTYFTDSAATTVLTNPNAVTTSGTYYIKGTNANGCSSIASVVVTINVTNAPTGTASQTFCGSANLSQLVVTGSNIRWYNAATGGTEYPASLWSLVGLVNGTTYYATQTVNGCESTTRLAVTAVINTIPSAPNASAQDFCSAPTVSQLLPNGSSINWYSASTGGTPLASTDILSANTYYVSQTINGCESTRTPVTITITALPAPTGATTQTVFGGVAADATIEDISVSGTNVIWYPTAADAAAGTNAIAAGTQLVDGSTYYAVSVIGSCRSNALAVTVTVTLDNRTFDLENLKFYPNPVVDQLTIVYTKEITSIQIYNLNGQLVKVVQPNATNVQVDMTELSTAMYIVKVYAEDKSAELKVYKK